MDHSITILSEKEKAILESYMLSADGLAEFWGENCEVIIHDLTQLDASVVKIVNGHLSGRQVGAPISEVTLNFVNKMMAFGSDSDAEAVKYLREQGMELNYSLLNRLHTAHRTFRIWWDRLRGKR